MKIPKTLKIGGHTYKVILRSREETDGVETLGSASIFTYLKIWVDSGQKQSQQESTLLHEIIEVISAINKVGLTEQQICILETGLYQVLNDNKMLK